MVSEWKRKPGLRLRSIQWLCLRLGCFVLDERVDDALKELRGTEKEKS